MSLNSNLDGLVKLKWSEIKNHFTDIESIKLNKDGSINIIANEYSSELQSLDNSHIHLGAGVDVSVPWIVKETCEQGALRNTITPYTNVYNNVTTLFNVNQLPAYVLDTVINGLYEGSLPYNPEICAFIVDAGARGTFIIGVNAEHNNPKILHDRANALVVTKRNLINNAFSTYSCDLTNAEKLNTIVKDNQPLHIVRLPQYNLTLKLPITYSNNTPYIVIDGNSDELELFNHEALLWWFCKNVYNT